MRKHIVLVAFSSILMGSAGSARAQGPSPRPGWRANALQAPSAWVLHLPLTLRVANVPSRPAVAFAPRLPAAKLDDSGEYPDPRKMPIRRFYLESQLEQDFTWGGVPLTSRAIAYSPDRAWQALDVAPAPIWQSDLVFRLPHDFFVGASAEQRTTAPRSLFVVAGPRF